MTLEQLELVCGREGLTRPQTAAVLAAAVAYATAQARAAIDALGPMGRSQITRTPWPVMHWQVLTPWAGPACDPPSGKPCTTDRSRVTCGACRQTPAWKKAA